MSGRTVAIARPGEGDPQAADAALGDRLHVGRHAQEARQHGLDPLEERGARRRQLDPPARAVEEAHAERRLQLGDLPAEGRLGDRERLGGLPEMEPAGHLPEVDEVAQLERDIDTP